MNTSNTSSYQLPLQSLLKGIEYSVAPGKDGKTIDSTVISGVTSDSRTAAFGMLFVALDGSRLDGHDFIVGAIENGCTAVLCEKGRAGSIPADWAGVLVEVEDSSRAYGLVAANYFGNPADQLTMIGVTGTNGKTTVTYLLESVLLEAGHKVGVIGTVNNRYSVNSGKQVILETRFTTPEAMVLQQVLRKMADSGVSFVIMEVSSHALSQKRISNIRFRTAAFTNLSRDHLDYHRGMEEYFAAKLSLFQEHLEEDGIAVLPGKSRLEGDAGLYRKLVRTCEDKCGKNVYWGDGEKDDVRLIGFRTRLEETLMDLILAGNPVQLKSKLVGRFNMDNVLTTCGLCHAIDMDMDSVRQGLEKSTGAPGRLERVLDRAEGSLDGPVVLVDYAHTPDALEHVLETVAALPHGEIFCVFGCGGDRDNGKRPLMGEIACRFSEVVLITDDNPRTEDPELIVRQILKGTKESGLELREHTWLGERQPGDRGIVVERDRRNAIRLAITSAGPEDVVLIAGKGHETYQLSLRGRQFFDDRLEAENILSSWTAVRVARATRGKLEPDGKRQGLLGPVSTDSRKIAEKAIFVALKGEHFDGHRFVDQALEKKCGCLVLEKEAPLPESPVVPVIRVEDTTRALGDMAAYRRKQVSRLCEQTVIGITGSCGKTTVKEMVSAILKRKWSVGPEHTEDSVLKTKGNFNNLIGLPLSLLPLNLNHRAVVLEMGMNQPGELRRLVEIADPDISCIVNVHGAHLEKLGSIDGVARAKEELFAGTRNDGILVVNLDDPLVSRLSEKYGQRKIGFSVSGKVTGVQPDLWTSDINLEDRGVITFTLHCGTDREDIHLYTLGEHNVGNSLAAAAIAKAAGAELSEIAAGLADFRAPDKRMEILKSPRGYGLLNDTYNANPASMAAGLKTLRQAAEKRAVAVLGDMLELGKSSAAAHFDLGRLVAELEIDHVAVLGEFRDEVRKGAVAGGMAEDAVKVLTEKKEAVIWVEELITEKKLGPGDLLLVKASRGLQFETIVDKLTG
ncbi:UDP-N-acetylmuramoyl-L-alanyl-D-glutamate--2,6-diaminopimelate ligase [Desulfomarina sp.]